MEWITESWAYIKERETLFAWIGSLSLATLIVSAIVVPIVIRRMPHDYFLENSEQTAALREGHPVLRALFLIMKNFVGGILVLGGILMLITPGQGVLTILIGLLLMNFPGKRRFEIWLIRLGPLNRAINWIRDKAGKRPLELPAPPTSTAS
ncbi:MAG: PGPGW domain-containing protein [Verrucomicrobiales bacterium]|nr:PGPGW domain-containing protein [Verrucomicrobiales bacterium]